MAANPSRKNIALLIDADNSPAAKIDFIITELATLGVVNIRRAYGNWKNPGLAGWEKVLHEFAIQPIQQFDLVKGKNATDIALVIDAMDILFSRNVDAFCLVSSDADFTPLVQRLRAEGKEVIGFGGQKAPEPFVNSCSRFLLLDEDKQAKENRRRRAADPVKLKGDTKLMATLRSAIEAVENDEGWAPLVAAGSHISNHSPIDHRNYGFKKLTDLFRAIDLFEVRETSNGAQHTVWVRNKKRGRKPGDATPAAETAGS
ncbi:MAG: NYN domain-containing protein [Terrimicrobiaceae bacterium]|nr:NYN domain-containing protein [Terrimicrobiaceae bacterium]